MISLNPPYAVIDGYTLLPDHADPGLFYALPPAPRLSAVDGRPAFSLLQYLGRGAGAAKLEGGILTLTTELETPPEMLASLPERLRDRLGEAAPPELRVTPVLFDDGVVELIALGQSSAPGAATPAGPFTVRFLGSGKPSLSGVNQASFQLMLDAAAAELVEAALEATDLPLIAVYRMGFAGLRPSFSIDIQADWSKLYRSLQNKADVNVYYVAANVDSMVSSALEENTITIDTTVFGVGEQAQARAERARKMLIDWVLERMFKPMVDPARAAANAVGEVVQDTVWSLARSVLPGVSYRLRMLEDAQLRVFAARMREAVAERREVIPQGTLGGMLHGLRVDAQGGPRPDWPALRDSMVRRVSLDGFPRIEIKVAVEDRFASDGLSEVRVELARRRPDDSMSDQRTLVFRSAAEREDYIVNLLGRVESGFAAPYDYRAETVFDPAGPFGPHDPVVSAWRTGSATELFVEPREAYAVREVAVNVAPIFSFAEYPAVTVELRYTADGAPAQSARLQLNEQRPSDTWRFRSFAAAPQLYEYRVTYHRPATGGGDIAVDWRAETDDWLTVPDPHPIKRPLNLIVNLPWPEILAAFVQLRYDDGRDGLHIDEQIDLAPELRLIRRDFPIADDSRRAISYRLTLLLTDGQLLEGSWRETDDERLILDRRLVERRRVGVRTVGGGLSDNRLSEVSVQLEVRDPETNQLREQTELALGPDEAAPSWEYLLGDPPAQTLHYSALFVDRNGFAQRTTQRTTRADLLIVDLRNKTIRA